MSKRRAFTRKRSHTTRNIAIAAILIVLSVTGIAVATHLPGFFTSSHPSSFPVIIHAYDSARLSSPDLFTSPDQLVANVTISMANATALDGAPLGFTQTTPTGVLAPSTPMLDGTYHVGATADGYSPAELNYVVGPDCVRLDSIGNCHIWIAMTRTL